jgi:predicted DNA-binding transcriptional regulator YafY
MFFLSRICSLAIMEETFDPRPFREWQAVLDSAFGLYHSGEHTPVVLRFRPERARFVREQVWHADQRMRDLPDGGLRLSFPVADFAEVKMMILGFGADVVVEEPEALQREVVEEIGRMTGVYGATD